MKNRMSLCVLTRGQGLRRLLVCVGMALLIVALTYPATLVSARSTGISWSEESLELNLSRGASTTLTVSITSHGDLVNASLWVTPEVSQFVSLTPSAFDIIEAGGTYPVTVSVSIPQDCPIRYYDGTIHLRVGRRTIPRPLKVLLAVSTEVTTYSTIEEQSSNLGSEGGQILLGDGGNVVIPSGTVDENVTFTISRKSAGGELPRSIQEDPDTRLISDFYFLQVDKVLDKNKGITLEFPFEMPSPSERVRVIEVFNIENETYPRFVDAIVDEVSGKVIVADIEPFPTEEAIQNYEAEAPPTGDTGFHGMAVSLGYAAIADTSLERLTLTESAMQTQSEGSTCPCSVMWGRIRCIGERAEVTVHHLYGTGDAMKEYACIALQYAESIQGAYSSAGFETHDKVLLHVTMIGWLADGAVPMPGSNKILIKKDLGTEKGGDLNLIVNHETVHTMQHTSVVLAPWWKESSADWIAYYFEPDEDARQMIRNKTVLFVNSLPMNPFRDPFPPWWGNEVYDFSVLVDYVVEAGLRQPEFVVDLINMGGDPTEVFAAHYRDRADGFAQYLAEEGYLKSIAQPSTADREFDSRSSGSVVLSIEVAPLTLPVKRYSAEVVKGMGDVTFRVTLEDVTNDGGVVIGTTNKGFEGLVDKNETSLSTTKGIDIYLMPFAKGSVSAEIKVLIEWEPWSPYEPDPNSNPWPMLGYDPQHTGQSPNLGAQSPNMVWAADVGGCITSFPAVDNEGTIYVVVVNNIITATRPDGTTKWTYTVGGSSRSYSRRSTAIAADGTIYVGLYNVDDYQGYLVALNPDGTEKWKLEGHGSSPLTLDEEGNIYFFHPASPHMGWDTAVVTPDGQEKWRRSGMFTWPTIGVDGAVYAFGDTYEGYVNALSLDSGITRWRFYVPEFSGASPRPGSMAVGPEGTIFAVGGRYDDTTGWGGVVYAINADGSLRWLFESPGTGYIQDVSVDRNGTVYAAGPILLAVDSQGDLKWSFGGSGYIGSKPAIGNDGTVYVINAARILYAIDEDGTEKWQVSLGARCYPYVFEWGPSIANGRIYVGVGRTLHALGD